MGMPQPRSLVYFAIVQNEANLPSTLDDQTIYFLQPSGKLLVGSNMIADRTSEHILVDTTANWNREPKLKSIRNMLYIYTDHDTKDGVPIPGFKVGDGSSYLIDMPFTDVLYRDHIDNSVIHVTQQDKDNWNNKVRCYVDDLNSPGNLIFTTH